jgi:hypothetical protein
MILLDLLDLLGLLDFHITYKILFSVHLKHFYCWPSIDVETVKFDLVPLVVLVCSLNVSTTFLQKRSS